MCDYINQAERRRLELTTVVEDLQEEDMKNANCRRHYTGGRALPINCWECRAEFAEDNYEPEDEDG
jgi:hypothetical protein